MSDHHEHLPGHFGKAFAFGILLNVGFVALEAFYGWKSGSLALLADAGHNLSDVGGLVLAWTAYGAARLRPNSRHTYGWRRGSILAGFANAIFLLVAMGSLAWEALARLQTQASIDAGTVMVVAGIGVLVNTATAWLFVSGSKTDLNIRGAFLHMAADALVSMGVVLAAVVYLWKGWLWIDPVVSLFIAVIVVAGTWSLFRQSLHLLFDGVPDGLDIETVRSSLLKLKGVVSVHDLHLWAMSTTENAITAHLVIDDNKLDRDELLLEATDVLHDRFEIRHVVLQPESRDYAAQCLAVRSCQETKCSTGPTAS